MIARAAEGGELDFAELRRELDRAERALRNEEELPPERRREILRLRARAVAGARAGAAAETEGTALLFRAGGERYAVPLGAVAIILPSRDLSTLAGAPAWLLGAVVARGRVVPVLDLRQLLKLEGGGMSDLTSVVVLESGGDAFGVAVEALEGDLPLPRAALEAPPEGLFRHVTADRVGVIDPEALAQAAGIGG